MDDRNLSIFLVLFPSAFGIAALWLWARDYLYTKRTGKPPSERLEEKREAANGPISKAQYYGRSVLYLVGLVLYSCALVWSDDFHGWRRISSILWICFFVIGVYRLQVKWSKQKHMQVADANSDQLTGVPR